MVVKDKQFSFLEDGKTTLDGTFQVVEVKGKTRKTDLTEKNGEKASLFTIAEWIDVDTFRTCVGVRRPTKFTTTGEGAGLVVVVFKRVKK